MTFDSLDLFAAAALLGAAIVAWRLAVGLRAHARLYLRFAAVLFAALAIGTPLGLGDAAGLLLLPLSAGALMISTVANLARPIPVFAACLALTLSLAGGLCSLLTGAPMAGLAPVMFAGLAVIAVALNGVAAIPILAGAALLAAGLIYLNQGAHAGLLFFCAAALMGLAKPPRGRKAQLLRSNNSVFRGQSARP
jgi:hypothetical protein